VALSAEPLPDFSDIKRRLLAGDAPLSTREVEVPEKMQDLLMSLGPVDVEEIGSAGN
jgi:hypothetical protein